MPCTEAYKEHIMYTLNGFCKTVIHYAAINAWRDRSRRRQKEISLILTNEELATALLSLSEYDWVSNPQDFTAPAKENGGAFA